MSLSRAHELEWFKSRINLTEFAAGQGYTLDRPHSSRNSVAMRGPDGDKIIIARDARDAHWMYFSVDNEQDHGTIIDFLDQRGRPSLGAIRQELRPWVGLAGAPPRRPPVQHYQPDVEPIPKDRAAMLAHFAACTPVVGGHAYLQDVRGIPLAVLDDPRFAGRLYTDRFRNALFPHHDRAGVCGFEIRNTAYKGFAKGAQKGLWYSTIRPEDTMLIVAESAIDALSYHALHRPDRARYFSIAGEMTPQQRALLAAAMRKLPQGATVILATDHDTGGLALARKLRAIVETSGRPDLGIMDHQPERAGDWNDLLTGVVSSPAPLADAPTKHGTAPPRLTRVLRPQRLRLKP